jgi:hypothetical protein
MSSDWPWYIIAYKLKLRGHLYDFAHNEIGRSSASAVPLLETCQIYFPKLVSSHLDDLDEIAFCARYISTWIIAL